MSGKRSHPGDYIPDGGGYVPTSRADLKNSRRKLDDELGTPPPAADLVSSPTASPGEATGLSSPTITNGPSEGAIVISQTTTATKVKGKAGTPRGTTLTPTGNKKKKSSSMKKQQATKANTIQNPELILEPVALVVKQNANRVSPVTVGAAAPSPAKSPEDASMDERWLRLARWHAKEKASTWIMHYEILQLCAMLLKLKVCDPPG